MPTGATKEPTGPGRIRWLDTAGGQQVLLIDLSYCTGSQVEELVHHAGEVIRAQPLASTLVLTDFTGAEFHPDLVALIKKIAALDQPHVKRTAWVGAEALSQLWHAAIERVSNRKIRRFATRDEAIGFLLNG